jgi:predicted amidophosphoribosyltransferase
MVQALKFRGARQVAEPLGALLAARLRRGSWLPDVVTHLPTDPARRTARGYDQAEALARGLADAAGLPYRALLQRARPTRRQAGLGRAARAANVRGAFQAVPGALPAGRVRVLVVDDVLTTGASLEECRRALLCVGAHEVRFAVVARTAGAKDAADTGLGDDHTGSARSDLAPHGRGPSDDDRVRAP